MKKLATVITAATLAVASTAASAWGWGDNGWGNNEWQLYTDSPDNVRVEGGNLIGTPDYFPFFKVDVTAIRFPRRGDP